MARFSVSVLVCDEEHATHFVSKPVYFLEGMCVEFSDILHK